MRNIGVRRGSVVLTDYQEEWNTQYASEKLKLLDVFKSMALKIEHIGGTSIPGSIAKPIIDIGVLVSDLSKVDNIIDNLCSLQYKERVGRLEGKQRVFAKGGDSKVTHHLHIIEKGEFIKEELNKLKSE